MLSRHGFTRLTSRCHLLSNALLLVSSRKPASVASLSKEQPHMYCLVDTGISRALSTKRSEVTIAVGAGTVANSVPAGQSATFGLQIARWHQPAAFSGSSRLSQTLISDVSMVPVPTAAGEAIVASGSFSFVVFIASVANKTSFRGTPSP